jgi:hypothetical protein
MPLDETPVVPQFSPRTFKIRTNMFKFYSTADVVSSGFLLVFPSLGNTVAFFWPLIYPPTYLTDGSIFQGILMRSDGPCAKLSSFLPHSGVT